MAVISATDKTVNKLEKVPLSPRYSALRNRINTVLVKKEIRRLKIWPIKEYLKFFIVFDTLDKSYFSAMLSDLTKMTDIRYDS